MKTNSDRNETETRISKLAYSYRRFSSGGQRDGSSLERQLQMAQEVCTEKGWQLVDLEPDQAMSGYSGVNRIKGSLGAFIARVNKGEISRGSCLIFEKMDRFSRNDVDLVLPDFLALLQAGIEVYSCVDKTHYTLADLRKTPMLITYAVMAMSMANDYSKSLGDRVTKAVAIRLDLCKQGFAMDLGPWLPCWINFVGPHKKPGKFEFNHHAETVKGIVMDYISGKSMYAINNRLVAAGTPTLKGGKWCQQTISNILHNPALIGDITINGTTLKGYLPAVIDDPDQYKALQAKLNENKTRKGGSERSDAIANLFRNRCTCFHCGETISTKKKGNRHIYTCKGKKTHTCKSAYSVNVTAIERDFFSRLGRDPESLLASQTPEADREAVAIQAEIARLDKAMADAAELIGVLPVAEIKTRMAKIENARQQAKAQLDQLNASKLNDAQAPKALAEIMRVMRISNVRNEIANQANRANWDRIQGNPVQPVNPELQTALANLTDFNGLSDNDTRKRLLGYLPSLVKKLVIDTTAKRYAVVNHAGVQSEWRTVA